MAYASKVGRARVSSTNPQAIAVCDRCGIWRNFVDLHWQYDWRGAALQNIRILVCRECYDTPQEQLRAIVVPADPLPIEQARVEPFLADESTYAALNNSTIDPDTGIPIPSTTTMGTLTGDGMTPYPIGRPDGLEQGAVMPLQSVAGVPTYFGVPIPVLSIIANGTDQIGVTCSAPHGLSTDGQISVEGLTNARATGFYSVAVTSATAFTYQTYGVIAAGSLLTSTTKIINCLVGLPLGYDAIPQVGP